METGRSAGAGKPDNEYANLLQEKTAALQEELDSPAFISLVADGKLFISSKAGSIYCFGADQQSEAITYDWQPEKLENLKNEDFLLAESLLQKFACQAGWALIPGGAGEGFLNALLLNSKLNLVVLEPDGERRQQLQQTQPRWISWRTHRILAKITEGDTVSRNTSLVPSARPAACRPEKEDSDLELVYKLLRPLLRPGLDQFPAAGRNPKKAARPAELADPLAAKRQSGGRKQPEFAPADGSLQQEGEALILAKCRRPSARGNGRISTPMPAKMCSPMTSW